MITYQVLYHMKHDGTSVSEIVGIYLGEGNEKGNE